LHRSAHSGTLLTSYQTPRATHGPILHYTLGHTLKVRTLRTSLNDLVKGFDVAACQRCSRFHRTLIRLSNRNWLANAETHYRTHPDVRGMNTLDFYGVRNCSTRLCDVPGPVTLDYASVCHGFWLPQVVYGETTYDASALLQDWRPGKGWAAEPHFEATLTYECMAGQRLVCPTGSKITWLYGSGATASGTVLGFESPTCMFVRPAPESCDGRVRLSGCQLQQQSQGGFRDQ